ncbi:hypothetical protein IHE32_03590 [Mycetohabitans rhizoxinica]
MLVKVHGQSSVLLPLGEKLLWAERMRVERLSPQSLSIEGADEIGRLITPARRSMQIYASHGHAIAALVQTLPMRRCR